MPSIEQNKQFWSSYDWAHGGHEWSHLWGSADDQWANTIYPRIFSALPTTSILEIASGFGRWIPFLLNYCTKYIGIDIFEAAVTHCRRTFSPLPGKPQFILGDGLHLSPAADNSIGFVFSFDSLVHAEIECISSYLPEIFRVLEPGGYAFLHHSNIGQYVRDGVLTVPNQGMRGVSVTAERVHELCRSAGLKSLVHEKIRWTFTDYTDCFSLMQKPASPAEGEPDLRVLIYENEDFTAEIQRSSRLSRHYTEALKRRSAM
jgi:SAM-dependent methyltransferase